MRSRLLTIVVGAALAALLSLPAFVSNYALATSPSLSNPSKGVLSARKLSNRDLGPSGIYSYTADYLVVAGGGSGGTGNGSGFIGGGGGAGAMEYVTGATFVPGTVLTATVGPGGVAISATSTVGNDGTASSLIGGAISKTALGGGGGGLANGGAGGNGRNGGSSGGGGGNNSTPTTAGTASGSNTNVGGVGGGSVNIAAAGSGGGAGAAGTTMIDNGTNLVPTAGASNSITGGAVTYGKGGGCYNSASPPAISANTGNGGSGVGGSTTTSIAGSTGVVIIRVLTANYTGTVTGSPTVTTDGSYTVIKFTSTGTYTA